MTKARSATLALTAFGLAMGGTPAHAQNARGETTKPANVAGPIVVDTAAAWTHPPTGVVLPPAIGTFTRTSVSQSEHGLADVSIGYNDNETGTTLTIYVFRAGWPQAPLWADRLSQVMGMTVQRLGGTPAGTPRLTVFTPTGHASASAMRVVQGAQGGALLATGAVVIPAGAWLVTMRMSSRKLDPAALDAQLAAAAAALRVPAPAKALPAAVPIAPCSDALSLPQAERAAPWDRHAILTGALLAATRNQTEPPKGKLPIGPDPRLSLLCRDPASRVERGLYRLPEDKQRYIIALGDAGVIIEAGPSVLAQIFKQPAMFDVTLSVFDKTAIYPPYASLPTPDQAMSALANVKPEAEVSDDKNVVILD
ncbi:hypothetical protein [Novosphingobium pokkalii]|uniref:Uncharacterized protein n=1 Tax=Novosphingobium pokkalii TaxID=1770194 RepID=A0ABV7V2W9_9SPHN|nr:hypothetical protein [Novosphingobium pokkalii]GHC93446.1 hypothetical protein GCM10019060_20430 [Novosphingobium pokkalii]